MELVLLSQEAEEVMFESIKELLTKLGLDLKKLVAIAIDGATCIIRCTKVLVVA